MGRKYRVGRIKRLRTYTVGQIAETLGAHEHTVRLWLTAGLEAIDRKRPTLVRGEELLRFLAAKRAVRKRTCPPGTIFCVKCREPRRPAGDMADLRELTITLGDLQAICSVCESMMYRRINLAAVASICPGIAVTVTQRERRIGERLSASVNCDSREPDKWR